MNPCHSTGALGQAGTTSLAVMENDVRILYVGDRTASWRYAIDRAAASRWR